MSGKNPSPESWQAAFRLARRESREGLKGFRIFALALGLGVFAIAAVGSLSAAFLAGLEKEQRRLLGGDYEITAIDTNFPEEARAWLSGEGKTSALLGARLMVRTPDGSRQSVVQMKAVDNAYPLLGSLEINPATENDGALATRTSVAGSPLYGAVADLQLFEKLGAKPGDRVVIGNATFILSGIIADEPDRASAGFLIAPRFMTSLEGAAATQLITRSGLVEHTIRVLLQPERVAGFEDRLEAAFPDHPWTLRSAEDAAGGLEATLRNLDVFLTMIGLASLVIGGVGAANAVHAYMQRKLPIIATLKCLGASGGFILKTYVIQILIVASLAVVFGLSAGAAVPFLVVGLLGGLLPFAAQADIYPVALAQAWTFGFLAALVFALWPLTRARWISPARLFRNLIEPDRSTPPARDLALIGGLALLFLGLALLFSKDWQFAGIFAGAGLVVYGLLRLLAYGLIRIARKRWRPASPTTRLAAASLTRPGAATAGVIVSLGLGLTLLAMVSLIDTNLSREVRSVLLNDVPNLFLSDIPYQERDSFDQFISESAPDGSYERYLMLRSGIKRLNGKPLDAVEDAADSAWARENDWGVTVLSEIPETLGTITDGTPWPPDYAGPPKLSLSAYQAERFDLDAGDTITLTIAGRDVTAEIATLHDVKWDRNGINFVAVFAPGTLEAANPSSIGSLRIDNRDESLIVSQLATAFPTVTVIRTADVTASIATVIDNIGLVIRALSAITLVAGLIVLMGAIAADFRRKLHDAMIMKAVGASRAHILKAYAVEYLVLGLVPAVAAVGLGLIASFYVVQERMGLDWFAAPMIALTIVGGATAITLGAGLAGAWRALAMRPWAVLRTA